VSAKSDPTSNSLYVGGCKTVFEQDTNPKRRRCICLIWAISKRNVRNHENVCNSRSFTAQKRHYCLPAGTPEFAPPVPPEPTVSARGTDIQSTDCVGDAHRKVNPIQ
jgi:hypothetical protein